MEQSNRLPTRKGERGAARAKLLIFLVIAGAMIYAGYLYLPVAYDAYLFKDLMQHNVTWLSHRVINPHGCRIN